MDHHTNGAATLPRGFRFHHEEPSTPEPHATVTEVVPPSPPRPARLKIKRRNVLPNFEAPTETFLASVTAADVPIPTIEVPRVEDSNMPDRESISVTTTGLLAPWNFDYRPSSPPKTPNPMCSMEENHYQHPDWSRGASSEFDDFDRPSSALSSLSDYSDNDSFYDGSNISRPSDDGSCTSPDSDIADPFQFPSLKGKPREKLPSYIQPEPLNANLRSKTRKNAPWSKAMSEHLWQTYLVYLQDPTVTPFRIGASAIPPEGVCHRVSREARRSWKGPKAANSAVASRRSTRLNPVTRLASTDTQKSGSLTPTPETVSRTWGQWPHSSAATRNHLRELCKTNSASIPRHRHLLSRSPTPFTKIVVNSIPRTPEPAPSASFSTKDISLSLTTSISESMQPGGPLAQLADLNAPSDAEATQTPLENSTSELGTGLGDSTRFRKLGSPFIARTYGPSSSRYIHPYERHSQSRAHPEVAPALGSPLRFEKTRSLNGIQKRRAIHALDEGEFGHYGGIIRPSILNEQLFGDALRDSRRVRNRGFSLGDEALRNRVPGLFQYTPMPEDPFTSSAKDAASITPVAEAGSNETKTLLPPATIVAGPTASTPRLGSPFTGVVSNTFPRRLFQDGAAANQTIKKSAFATMHQTRRSIESFDFGEGGPSLQSRLTRLDHRLAEIRESEAAKRSES
ncbi:hypothetical protein PVAG01_09292 [Phlyctema vagabunda]|uniref:Uncharacterized protein n=1 Tax=Phlyctema vagabunda TaxID=108571 RepID=A0ABR4P6Y8_9HELO